MTLRHLSLFAWISLLSLFSSISVHAAYQISRLSNGLTVIVSEDHSVNLIAVDVWVKSGSGSDPAGLSGMAHLNEHLSFGATTTRKPGQMDVEMESAGASLDAHTSKDWAHFNTTVTPANFLKALDVLHDAVSNPLFDKTDVELEKAVILDEISRNQSDPVQTCKDYLAKLLYGLHPYAHPIVGSAESVKKITPELLASYHKAQYRPENLAVVIVGDVDAKQAFSAVNRLFASATQPKSAPDRITALPPSKPVLQTIQSPYKLDYIGFGFIGPAADCFTDVCAVDVLLTYFGMGFRSWMITSLKDQQHLVESASADFLTERDGGMISLIAAANHDKSELASIAITKEIERIKKEGISDSALAVAKASLIGQFAFENETFAGTANTAGFYFAVSQPERAVEYQKAVQAISNEDIMRVANKYMNLNQVSIVLLTNKKRGAQ